MRRWLTAGPALLALPFIFLAAAPACGDGAAVPVATDLPAPTQAPTLTAPPTIPAESPMPSAAARAPGADLVAAGRELFTGGGGCLACHTIEGVAQGILGPDLSRIGALAAGRIPGYTAEQYIRESITESCAYTVSPADAGIDAESDCGLMAATLAGIQLSDADVDALVAFLLEQQ